MAGRWNQQPKGRWNPTATGRWNPESQGRWKAKAEPKESGGFWNWSMKQLTKPVAAASNLLEDVGKTIAYPVAKAMKPGTWQDYKQKTNIDFLGHQKDVWTGKNQRTYSDFSKEYADANFKGDNLSSKAGRFMAKATGYGGDVILDPLNKVKILGLTGKGEKLVKTGGLALSAAEQAQKGERALLQIGKTNILPKMGNKVLEGSTKVNDWLRRTKYGQKAVTALTKVSGKVRPIGVARDEFKSFTDAATKFRATSGYRTQQAIEVASGIEKELRKRGIDDATRSAFLHAVEKGDKALAPETVHDLFDIADEFRKGAEGRWMKAGGPTVEGYGLAHVATPEVAETSRKKALSGGKLYSPKTPQDIHRKWVRISPVARSADGALTVGDIIKAGDRGNYGRIVSLDGDKATVRFTNKAQKTTATKTFSLQELQGANAGLNGPRIANLSDEGIRYSKQKGRYFDQAGRQVRVEQATAKEINDFLKSQGKNPVFREDLPTALARMGVSAGKKEAGQAFLDATQGVTSEAGRALVDQTHERLTNVEAVNKFIKGYDKALGFWKAQALVAPSYHVRNAVGNVWNNYLAGTAPTDYAKAMGIQKGMKSGKLDAKAAQLVKEMEEHGVLGEGWFASDITQTIDDQVKGASWKPWKQNNKAFAANKAVGSAVEDNARIAHYLSKRRAGYTAEEAAKSVNKFLFDYGDLTWGEKNILKRALPFYTWMSKNVPLQVEQFVKQPGKFAKVAVGKKDNEAGVEQPNEKYLSDYIKGNSPIRFRKDKDGSTQYLLMGQWLPASSALQVLSQPLDTIVGMLTPALKMPAETLLNKSSFFKNSTGDYQDLEAFPGQKKNFLGLDLSPKTINVLRSVRFLNELDKLNPGEVFGSKQKGSVWNKLNVPNASRKRGSRYAPDSSQTSRVINMFVGKATNYDSKNSKFFYDRDTQDRVAKYKSAIKDALRNKNPDMAKKERMKMRDFLKSR